MSDAAPASSSRKLAAIFAADVFGYSVMMTADEEGTVRKLKAVQAAVLPIIVEHGGRVISLAGDGVMAEFASAIRAVESALSVQRRVEEANAELGPEMLFRIGINIGDVIQEGRRVRRPCCRCVIDARYRDQNEERRRGQPRARDPPEHALGDRQPRASDFAFGAERTSLPGGQSHRAFV